MKCSSSLVGLVMTGFLIGGFAVSPASATPNRSATEYFLEAMEDRLGERFAGSWWSRKDARATFRVVAPTEEDRHWAGELAPAGLAVRVIPAKYSQRQIEGFARRAERVLKRPEYDKEEVGISMDDRANAITIVFLKRQRNLMRRIKRDLQEVLPSDSFNLKVWRWMGKHEPELDTSPVESQAPPGRGSDNELRQAAVTRVPSWLMATVAAVAVAALVGSAVRSTGQRA